MNCFYKTFYIIHGALSKAWTHVSSVHTHLLLQRVVFLLQLLKNGSLSFASLDFGIKILSFLFQQGNIFFTLLQ